MVCCDTIFSQQFEILPAPYFINHLLYKEWTQPTDSKVGFHLGAGYKIPFDGILFFSPPFPMP
jgi:hypothetical protein